VDTVASFKTGRQYRIEGEFLVTSDDQTPHEKHPLDYGTCERLALLCEECRQKVFWVAEGKREKKETLEVITIQSHFSHYSAKAGQFCSKRHKTPEGRKAYERVLAPVARGQWLNRFQEGVLYAITCDPVEPIMAGMRQKMESADLKPGTQMSAEALAKMGGRLSENGEYTFDFDPSQCQPNFRHLRLSPRVAELELAEDPIMALFVETARREDFRAVMHESIDLAWETIEKTVADGKLPEQTQRMLVERIENAGEGADWAWWQAYVRHALVHSYPGGATAQNYCSHLALDFLLAEPQEMLLRQHLTDCLGVFDMGEVPVFEDLVRAKNLFTQGRKTQAEVTIVLIDLEKAALEYAAECLAICPWQAVWEPAIEFAKQVNVKRQRIEKAQQRKAKRETPSRAKGFA